MTKKKHLLYITFVDMEQPPSSGSAVRPLKMLEAFRSLDIDVTLLSGRNKDIRSRYRNVSRVKKHLDDYRFDICYIEPPSGPMFCYEDIRLIRRLHHRGIPIALFYRDAYWRYPDFYISEKSSLVDKLKLSIIRMMQIFQLKVFIANCDTIYFPSLSMMHEFHIPNANVLPPGAFIPDDWRPNEPHSPLRALFVGGASVNYGTLLTLDAFREVNSDRVVCELTYICPERQWDSLGIELDESMRQWLKVVHVSGDKELRRYYEWADFALLTAPRSFYRDFAVPIKIFEYMSYLKPILVTNCTETARIVNDNNIGWVVNDNVNDIAQKLKELSGDTESVSRMKANMFVARENNLWIERAKKVIFDLSGGNDG